jgi:serine protease Do
VKDARGAVVARVHPDGPAAGAGVRPNDVIVKFESTPVDDYTHLQRLSADAEVGKSVTVEIVRRGERKHVTLKIAEAPDSAAPQQR